MIFTIALISCNEEVNHDCLSNKYECVPTMTVSPITKMFCESCDTRTLECMSCGSQTIIPTFTLDVTGEMTAAKGYESLLDSALFYHQRSVIAYEDSFNYYNKRLQRLSNLKLKK